MPVDILMPALSPTMEKGTLIQWMKSVGDKVRSGELIAEVETDKATMDVEAGADGTLSAILVAGGTADVPVNIVIGKIAIEGESSSAVPASHIDGIAAVEQNDVSRAANSLDLQAAVDDRHSGRIFASPIARRLMAEAGLDPNVLVGTGPHGRILERDVKAAIEARKEVRREPVVEVFKEKPHREADTVPVPALAPQRMDDDVRKFFAEGSYEEVPHDAMRRTIARRLSESKRSVPHFYLAADCTIDKLLAMRKELNAPTGVVNSEGHRLSINDFVVKALALALRKVPDANVSFAEDAMLRHRHIDVGIAVAIAGGLLTPIIRRADIKTITAISAEARELADRAKIRRLEPQEYTGGTASVSNLGMYGVQEFTAIVNPPQATILAVGAAERRVIVNEDDTMSVASIMRVTLSADHRAVDGATAAQLLNAFKTLIENPMAMLI